MFLQRFFFFFVFLCSLAAPALAAEATFSWLPNSETNLTGYKIYYGLSSGNYTNVIDVGLPAPVDGRIQATVTGLDEGTTYYFAATAYNSDGLESDYSAEVSHTFTVVGDTVIKTFGDATGTDYPGTLAETHTNINDTSLEGSETISTWSWSSPTPHKVANTIILKADLSAIPADATILDAQLYLYQTESFGETAYVNTVHKITGHNPIISEVSGYNAATGTPWNTVPDGTTYNNVPLGLADISAAEDSVTLGTTNGYQSWSVTNMVRDWLADPSTNFGLLINGQSDMASETGRTFAASENADGSIRPKLVVTYSINSSTAPPSASDSTASGNEDSTISGVLVVDNPSGLALTYTVTSGPTHGTLTIEEATGQFTYQPGSNFNGTDSFSYTAANSNGTSNAATVNLTVNPVNDTPSAQGGNYTGTEDTALVGQLQATDPDGDTLSYTVIIQPAHGQVNMQSDGSFSYVPATDWYGNDSFSFVANDGSADSNSAVISLVINSVNDVPVAASGSYTLNENEQLIGQVTGADSDGDPLSYRVDTPAAHGSLTINADGSFTYTPLSNWYGNDSFTFIANDGTSDSNSATISLVVNAVNDAPIAENSSYTINEDGLATGQVQATDNDGDQLTFIITVQAAHGSVTLESNGNFTYTPIADWNGTDAFSFTANDGNVDSNTATVSITVNPVNDLPVAAGGSYTGSEDTQIDGRLTATDKDGDSLAYILTTQAVHGSVTVDNNGNFTYTPDADWNGTDAFSFIVNDGNVDSNTATVSLNVNPVNDPPVATNSSVSTSEDTPVNGSVTGSDPDGDTLSYSLGSQAAHGSVALGTDGSFTYTPATDWNGTDTFTFIASDGTATADATVTVTVNAVNDTPVAAPASLSAEAGATYSGRLNGSDVDGDNLSFALQTTTSQGELVLNSDGSYTYTANATAEGLDDFTFTVSDGLLTSAPATVTIDITAPQTAFRVDLIEVQVDSNWQTISFDAPFINPVVIARASTFNDANSGVIRTRNITSQGFELRFQEWDYLDDLNHTPETVTIMIMEAGSFILDNGARVEAGCFSASGASSFASRSFEQAMNTVPVVMTAVNTVNETDAVTTRIRNISTNGFEFMMREQESNTADHAEETACYIAWEPSMDTMGSIQYEVAATDDAITNGSTALVYRSSFVETPAVIAAMQSTDGADTSDLRINCSSIEGLSVFVNEEQSRDSEVNHTTETGAYIAIAPYDPQADSDNDGLSTRDEQDLYTTHPGIADTDNDGINDGEEVAFWLNSGQAWDGDIDNDGIINLLDSDSDNDGASDGAEKAAGFDPADPTSRPLFPIMEGGEVELTDTWVHIDFTNTYARPVVIARLVSRNDLEPVVVRINNVTSTGFDLRLQEYDYQDGIHGVEQVGYLVMEEGEYTLADGTLIEAGQLSTCATTTYAAPRFKRSFNQVPVLVTSVTSFNEADTVLTRIRNIDLNGFELKLREQEANAAVHAQETVSYIAWEPSSGSENGMSYDVNRSANVITHNAATLNYTTDFGSRPLLYTDMQTTDGGDTSILRTVSNDAAGMQVMVEEETSRDSETWHTSEVGGFIAILNQ